MTSHLIDWTPEQFRNVEEEILTAKHNLHQTGLFDDEGLIKLFDTHPEDEMVISTMGQSTLTYEWRDGDRNGVSSEDLLDLLYKGRLWINMRNVREHHSEVRKAIDSIYDEIEAKKPGFKAQNRSGNLLLSSPGAIVHYHMDVPVNMLWHIQGTKNVWVYPPFDEKYSPQKVLEKICAAEMNEDAPFDPSFDDGAQVFHVEPGQLLTWPQLTPHRVENTGDSLHISLSTEHKNARAIRRINVHQANHFLRQTFGVGCNSFAVEGPAAHGKQAFIRAVRKFQQLTNRVPEKKNDNTKSFKLDLNSPTGVTILEGVAAPLTPEEQMAA